MNYGLGIDNEWAVEQTAKAVRAWRDGKHKAFGSVEQYLREFFPTVEDDALRLIKRIEKEQSK
jgi:hypothetical protein